MASLDRRIITYQQGSCNFDNLFVKVTTLYICIPDDGNVILSKHSENYPVKSHYQTTRIERRENITTISLDFLVRTKISKCFVTYNIIYFVTKEQVKIVNKMLNI